MDKFMKQRILMVALICALTVPVVSQDAGSAPGGGQRRGSGQGFGMGRSARVMGAVTAVNGKSLTVKDEEGVSWTIDTTDNTRVVKDRQPAKFADIVVGTPVAAMGMPEGDKKEIHALFVNVMTPEEAQRVAEAAAKAKENLGKTYLTGRVTKIDMDALKITVARPDKTEQTAAVDENTKLRRGGNPNIADAAGIGQGFGGGRRAGAAPGGPSEDGEPITLADIKVGDNIVGPGAVAGGVFVFKELHVVRGPRLGTGPGPAMPPPSQPQQ